MPDKELFILAGNGLYLNRGCEAILRGTVKILRRHFDTPQFRNYSNFEDKTSLDRQRARERDPDIVHNGIWCSNKRFDAGWFTYNILKRTSPRTLKHLYFRSMEPYIPQARAVLALGGDNYSLDYGRPVVHTELNELVVSLKKPLIIWGASVGPFSNDPDYEKYMIEHLRKVHVFARESLTQEYLNEHGLVENVHRVADPAFLLEAVKPAEEKLGITIEDEAIGVNISPLLAAYKGRGNLNKWTAEAACIVQSILARTERRIYLIPHVTHASVEHDDYTFMRNVARLVDSQNTRVIVVPDTLDAAEIKWVISKMSLFAGARTHSTIASLSSCVPTLSFGYSVKSRGINKDIFGHMRYCLQVDELAPETVADRVSEMLSEMESIKEQLRANVPQKKVDALSAGEILRTIVNKQ